ncbi:hypothetical protein [Zunongwangia sp. HGR-M22]|uniref:hypothetical protein n=1 Tax=Zunongwangia sp. HGR-M22 TaxID=3015168 RepID=UPI0022DDCD08|nr:hypothetical protein [Zunongwangia sp. HGR-M22]WBL25484.1 hypothetical protein PBT91_16510 [Zunongwangia sp. HGR-M22]
MNLEEDNRRKRAKENLSKTESLQFFILPFITPRARPKSTDDFSQSQLERFKNYGYDTKLKQANQLIIYGIIFWIGLVLIITYLTTKYL